MTAEKRPVIQKNNNQKCGGIKCLL